MKNTRDVPKTLTFYPVSSVTTTLAQDHVEDWDNEFKPTLEYYFYFEAMVPSIENLDKLRIIKKEDYYG